MRRAAILTGHFPRQKRRPSLLWVADALRDQGWHVTVVTVGYSWLSVLRRDPRLRGRGACSGPLEPDLDAVFALPPIHPFSTRLPRLDAVLAPLHRIFAAWWAPRLRRALRDVELVIVESGPPILLAPAARKAAPAARLIYRVNDDIRLLNAPAWLTAAEPQLALQCDRLSTASRYLARRFDHPRITLDPMGLPRQALAAPPPADPFRPRAPVEAVCAGTTQIDLPALIRLAKARREWRIHVIGRLPDRAGLPPNLHCLGERDFRTTLAHILHADIGLAAYRDRPGVEYQSDNSNRMLLYRHAGLPILGPARLCRPDRPEMLDWTDTAALDRAARWTRRPERLPDWSDLARRLADPDPAPDPRSRGAAPCGSRAVPIAPLRTA